MKHLNGVLARPSTTKPIRQIRPRGERLGTGIKRPAQVYPKVVALIGQYFKPSPSPAPVMAAGSSALSVK
jgi:hypothetical protein